MPCEICGNRKVAGKARIDGILFSVCEMCAKFGSFTASGQQKSEPERIRIKEAPVEDVLPDYNKIIRQAREKMGITAKELAEKKLEKFLGIKLKGIVSGGEDVHSNLPTATLGDLAEVKTVSRPKN
jgi:ribosome-binding protein aMBF1 (putative translation factor)